MSRKDYALLAFVIGACLLGTQFPFVLFHWPGAMFISLPLCIVGVILLVLSGVLMYKLKIKWPNNRKFYIITAILAILTILAIVCLICEVAAAFFVFDVGFLVPAWSLYCGYLLWKTNKE